MGMKRIWDRNKVNTSPAGRHRLPPPDQGVDGLVDGLAGSRRRAQREVVQAEVEEVRAFVEKRKPEFRGR